MDFFLRAIYNVFSRPLSRFPGPPGAACTTRRWWLAYMQLGRGISLSTCARGIIRNMLHFSRPTAYNEIYNTRNKWDKDYGFYWGFDPDKAFFPEPSTIYFCDALREQHAAGNSGNLYLGFECFGADTITNFLFATSFDQRPCPDFRGDVVGEGIDQAIPSTLRKFSSGFVWILHNFPASILMVTSLNSTKGLIVIKNALKAEIKNILRNPRSLDDAPHRTIYREFLYPEVNKGHHHTLAESQLLDEAQVLFTAGSHTVGTALMTGACYHLLRSPEAKQRLVDETAVIKEMLRMAVAVPMGLPRVVPRSGAVISGVRIPGSTVVSQSDLFVSCLDESFAQPHEFMPDRWLQPGSRSLENWLVAFSKGPRRRSCLGIKRVPLVTFLPTASLTPRFPPWCTDAQMFPVHTAAY
ncbi:cytochrome P450 [Russula brevipes]|nr:cytochrome P450 [Russula brevipes]